MRRCILVLSLAVLLEAHDAAANSGCPSPSVEQGGQCILWRDAVLSDTMWITSGTKLNCQGHRLMPVTPGTLDDPRTATNEFQPSQPELAVLVHRSYDVKIQNCVISGFDFGIIVAQSKTAAAPAGAHQTANKILDNTIEVRTNAIDVIKSDGVIVSGNRLTYASERGRGVVLEFDSDENEITGNTIISTGAASTGLVRHGPGGPLVTETGVMDNMIQSLQGDKSTKILLVSEVVIQVAAGEPSTDIEDSGRPDHNVIEANHIIGLGPGPSCTLDPGTSCRGDADCVPGKGACLLKQNSGVGFNFRAADTIVRGNHFSGRMDRGVSFGGVAAITTIANWFPGSCTQDANRICSIDPDCNIPGTPGVGSCIGSLPVTLNGNTMRLTAEENMLSGVFDIAGLLASSTSQFTFRGNTVNGGISGIRVQRFAINGSVERNVVSGAANALYLQPDFTSTIRLNDFTGYSVAIRTSNDFTISTDITAGEGNYWGLSCPGFDPLRVFFDNGAVNPYVLDGKPYGKPVARTPEGRLPTPCK